MLTAKPLQILTHIHHGFFTREGGVSKGIYASLNCGHGSNDRRDAVTENRARVAQKLSAEADKLVTLYQIHSAEVVEVTEPWAPGEAPQADGMVTTTPGIALGILTADCAPVLFVDKKARVVGAAHAGWKGAIGGVLEATIEAMIRLGATRSDIAAAIGPCISKDAYEVGPEFCARFIEEESENSRWFEPSEKADHFMFNLPGYVSARLETGGIGTVVTLGNCTYQDEKRFFSYRRATHRSEIDYGRQISAIMLRP